MNDQKNTIVAIVLSALVLFTWQIFFGLPQLNNQRSAQEQAQSSSHPRPSSAEAPVPVPQAPAPQTRSREEALAASTRIPIETPRIKGSIALMGGRIDDVSLTKYHETVDPSSPAIILLSPSWSPDPFYAEFGWLPGANATTKLPTSTTVWPNAAPSMPSPRTVITVGAVVSASAGTVITVASVNEANARALTRSAGT